MRTSKIHTTSALGPSSKPLRHTLKEQEVQELSEQAEDLETSIAVHFTLMQDVSSKPSGEETESACRFPLRILDKLQQQQRKLEAAIHLIRTQRDLCDEKAQRCEAEAQTTLSNEKYQACHLASRIERLQLVNLEKTQAIHSLEETLNGQEKDIRLLTRCQKGQVDLNGLALRVARLTRSVKMDEKAVETEKLELLERCEALEEALRAERMRFPREIRVRKAGVTAKADYGLTLTYENYLLAAHYPPRGSLTVAISNSPDIIEEAREDEFRRMNFKSKSEDNVAQYVPDTPPPPKVDEVDSRIEELFLAVRMKNEETASLLRLSCYLDAQKALLTHKINQVKANASSVASERRSQGTSSIEDEGASL